MWRTSRCSGPSSTTSVRANLTASGGFRAGSGWAIIVTEMPLPQHLCHLTGFLLGNCNLPPLIWSPLQASRWVWSPLDAVMMMPHEVITYVTVVLEPFCLRPLQAAGATPAVPALGKRFSCSSSRSDRCWALLSAILSATACLQKTSCCCCTTNASAGATPSAGGLERDCIRRSG